MEQIVSSSDSSSSGSSTDTSVGDNESFGQEEHRSPSSVTTEESVEDLLIIPDSDLFKSSWSPALDDTKYLSQLISSPYPHAEGTELAIQEHEMTLSNGKLALGFKVPALFSDAFTEGEWTAHNRTLSANREPVSFAESMVGYFEAPLACYLSSKIKVEPTILVKNNEDFVHFLEQHYEVDAPLRLVQEEKSVVTPQPSTSAQCHPMIKMQPCSSSSIRLENSMARAIASMDGDADELMETEPSNVPEGEPSSDYDEGAYGGGKNSKEPEMDPLQIESLLFTEKEVMEASLAKDCADVPSSVENHEDVEIAVLISPGDSRTTSMRRNIIDFAGSALENKRNLVSNAPKPEDCVAMFQQREPDDAAAAFPIQEELFVRRSTRVRKAPTRYADMCYTDTFGKSASNPRNKKR